MELVQLKISAVIVNCHKIVLVVPGEQISSHYLPWPIWDFVTDHGLFGVGGAIREADRALAVDVLNLFSHPRPEHDVTGPLLALLDAQVTGMYA